MKCNNCRFKHHSCSSKPTERCGYVPIEEGPECITLVVPLTDKQVGMYKDKSEKEINVVRNKIEIHRLICVDLNKTYEVKNERYGDSFKKLLEEYGDIAFLLRIGDKFERIKTLLKNPSLNDQQDESVYDTIKDLANYCLMYLVENSIKKDLEAGNK